jgi:hypothetical protein
MAGGFGKGRWSEDENRKLLQAVESNGQRLLILAVHDGTFF